MVECPVGKLLATDHFFILVKTYQRSISMEMSNSINGEKGDSADCDDLAEKKIEFEVRTFKKMEQLKRQNCFLKVVASSAILLLTLSVFIPLVVVLFEDQIIKKVSGVSTQDAHTAFLQQRTVNLLSNRSTSPVHIRFKVVDRNLDEFLSGAWDGLPEYSHFSFSLRWSLDSEGRLAIQKYDYSEPTAEPVTDGWRCIISRHANYSELFGTGNDFTDCNSDLADQFELRVFQGEEKKKGPLNEGDPVNDDNDEKIEKEQKVFFAIHSKKQPLLCLTCPTYRSACETAENYRLHWKRCAVEEIPSEMVDSSQLFYLHGDRVDYSGFAV